MSSILQPIIHQSVSPILLSQLNATHPLLPWCILATRPAAKSPEIEKMRDDNVHTLSTPSNLPPLPHTLLLPAAVRFGLALHVVVIERFAAVADEEGCAHQRRGGGAAFGDGGHGGREGGRVDEDFLGEAVGGGLVGGGGTGQRGGWGRLRW